MLEVSIGRVESFADPGRKIVAIDGIEIGVFHLRGTFTAFENICPHLAGPVCQGLMLPRTVDNVAEDNVNLARHFSTTQHNVICPWHGMEFDISTGEHVTTKALRLRKIEIRVEDGEVFVKVPERRYQHINSSLHGERQRPARDDSAKTGSADARLRGN
jgi:nitrite reductase/ring-hydroxylating ferredoxin subunit